MENGSTPSGDETESKGDFALRLGVHRARISQYLAAGIIGPDALVGTGRHARINIAKAVAQVRARRHIGQALGNGIATKLDEATPAHHVEPPADDLARQIQLERLEQERRKNRREAVAELVAAGGLVPVEDMRRSVARIATRVAAAFTGALPTCANSLASRFEIPQRDVLHLLRQEMDAACAAAANAIRADALAIPETVEFTLDADTQGPEARGASDA